MLQARFSSPRGCWSLKGRTAVVTGGSRGIGQGIVEEFLDQGCTAVTCAREVPPLRELCEMHTGKLAAVSPDVSTHEGRATVMAAVEQVLGGRLDVLLSSVGTNVRKNADAYGDEKDAWMMRTNLDSAFHLRRKCLPYLRNAGAGTTTNSAGAPLPRGGCVVSAPCAGSRLTTPANRNAWPRRQWIAWRATSPASCGPCTAST